MFQAILDLWIASKSEQELADMREYATNLISLHTNNSLGGCISPAAYFDIPEVQQDMLVAQLTLGLVQRETERRAQLSQAPLIAFSYA